MSSDWSKLQQIFEAWALDAESRRVLLAQRCAGDAELLAEERL